MYRRYKRLENAYGAVILVQFITVLILSSFSRLLGTIAGIPLVVSVAAGMWTLGEDLFD